jgi:hypothetical protein
VLILGVRFRCCCGTTRRFFSDPGSYGIGCRRFAVALALQDTACDILAGVHNHILVETPSMVGDFIGFRQVKKAPLATSAAHNPSANGRQPDTIVSKHEDHFPPLTNNSMQRKRVAAEVLIMSAARCRRMSAGSFHRHGRCTSKRRVLDDPNKRHTRHVLILACWPTHLQMKLIVHVATRMEVPAVQSAHPCPEARRDAQTWMSAPIPRSHSAVTKLKRIGIDSRVARFYPT